MNTEICAFVEITRGPRVECFAELHMSGDVELFGLLGGFRDGTPPVIPLRGLPTNASTIVLERASKLHECDLATFNRYHLASYLYASELHQVEAARRKRRGEVGFSPAQLCTELLYDSYDEFLAVQALMAKLLDMAHCPRFVFWFV